MLLLSIQVQSKKKNQRKSKRTHREAGTLSNEEPSNVK